MERKSSQNKLLTRREFILSSAGAFGGLFVPGWKEFLSTGDIVDVTPTRDDFPLLERIKIPLIESGKDVVKCAISLNNRKGPMPVEIKKNKHSQDHLVGFGNDPETIDISTPLRGCAVVVRQGGKDDKIYKLEKSSSLYIPSFLFGESSMGIFVILPKGYSEIGERYKFLRLDKESGIKGNIGIDLYADNGIPLPEPNIQRKV